ncbi:hypothetical protein HK101_005672 [Irineochytrium annulatum]|nr:hypothetical protein HK101_005672 [Irineochytrium annulatum]
MAATSSTPRRVATTALLFALLRAVVAQDGTGNIPTGAENDYNCPSSCKLPSCYCASKSIPGGLSLDDTPMFITLTLDDSVQDTTYDAFMEVQNSTKNPNGCILPATYFVSIQWTNFWRGTQLYARGNEIACHTVTHPDLTTVSASQVTNELKGSWDAINLLMGVPATELVGFRHPFLAYNAQTFAAVKNAGFYYESSITADPIVTPFWPHTLDYGTPYSTGAGALEFPGLWEIPMYTLLSNTTSQPSIWSAMDPIIIPQDPTTYDQMIADLQYTFLVHYKQKLPFGLYQHVAQYIAWPADVNAEKTKKIIEFVKWTQTFPGVWYVTNTQLLDWIKNPVPLHRFSIPCEAPLVSPSQKEICDGIDNNGDGTIDEGVVLQCSYHDTVFQSCYACPSSPPSLTAPITGMPAGSNRTAVPAGGCTAGPWDPIAGKCVEGQEVVVTGSMGMPPTLATTTSPWGATVLATTRGNLAQNGAPSGRGSVGVVAKVVVAGALVLLACLVF